MHHLKFWRDSPFVIDIPFLSDLPIIGKHMKMTITWNQVDTVIAVQYWKYSIGSFGMAAGQAIGISGLGWGWATSSPGVFPEFIPNIDQCIGHSDHIKERALDGHWAGHKY